MEIQQRNLSSLKAEFHDAGKAFRGLKTISKYRDNLPEKSLAHLLRHHDEGGVRGKELKQRFEIDSLIEFYNLLLTGTFAGYLPKTLNFDLNVEINAVLGDPAVEKYYTVHYPYQMTDYTLRYVRACINGEVPEQESGGSTDKIVFNEFASLNRMLRADKDMERFMGMLDFVIYDGYALDDVLERLTSYEKLSKSLTSKRKTEADRGVLGFIKYTSFLSQMRVLLESSANNPELQSAMWMFHGYYLDRLNDKMKSVFKQLFDAIGKTFSSPTIFAELLDELNGNFDEEISEEELLLYARSTVSNANEDVKFILEKHWGTPLRDFIERIEGGVGGFRRETLV